MSTKIRFYLIILFISVFAACKKDNDTMQTEQVEENRFVRLLVADAEDKTITFINPKDGAQSSFQAQFAANNIYPTNSKRFAGVVNTANNHVSFFDSGVEAHGDHAHLKGTPKWALTTALAAKPTHFYSLGNEIAVFNDGDASLSIVTEDKLHTQAQTNHVVVDQAHHGAVVVFANGTYAVTQKDNSISGALPERVKIVNATGQVIHTSTVATKGIHGDAGDGNTAIFGTVGGMLIVKSDGTQSLVNWPSEIGEANWLSTIYYGKGSQKFLGFKSKFGAFVLNPVNNSFTKVVTANNIRSAVFDAEGKDILVLLEDGTVQLYSGSSLIKLQEIKLNVSFGTGALVPNVTATKHFVYVTNPNGGEIIQLERGNFAKQSKIAVAGKPAKIIMLGADFDDEGNH
ncbi:hypothetical protein [Pedobacter glucosidilyticus]|uniref:hypothetical protein n=1 Tax=Pedobacter glucosidilyticus TaxID=1122941 RepID=UPI0004019985|nr:hypothetical protein [Pedobacter glucosidilyticus]